MENSLETLGDILDVIALNAEISGVTLKNDAEITINGRSHVVGFWML